MLFVRGLLLVRFVCLSRAAAAAAAAGEPQLGSTEAEQGCGAEEERSREGPLVPTVEAAQPVPSGNDRIELGGLGEEVQQRGANEEPAREAGADREERGAPDFGHAEHLTHCERE